MGEHAKGEHRVLHVNIFVYFVTIRGIDTVPCGVEG